MSRVYKIANLQQPSTSIPTADTVEVDTDWDKCVLCQDVKGEALQCPATSRRKNAGAGYKTLAENLAAFKNINCLPSSILFRLGWQNTEEILTSHKAKWHDSCRLQYNKTKLDRATKRHASSAESADDSTSKKFIRRNSGKSTDATELCFFCDKPAELNEPLHRASTFGLDAHVRECALQLQDENLLAKLSTGDLIALEAKYHVQCLVSLYNQCRRIKPSYKDENISSINHGLALAELVAYIEDARADNVYAPVFKLSDLAKMYSTRVEQLGTQLSGRVNSYHLKNRILAHFPDLQTHKEGRDILLVFSDYVGSALKKACENDADTNAIHLANAAKIVRRDILNTKASFTGTFDKQCQESSVPNTLAALVSMILYGPNIQTQSSYSSNSQATLTLAQLLTFNTSQCRDSSAQNLRHNQERETPLPLYLGVLMHTKTRKKELVDCLFELGLCISYDRVLNISTSLGNNLCRYFNMAQAVCPPKLKNKLFTTAAIDNIDHNPTSSTAQESFHGTGISIFQHPRCESSGIEQSTMTDFDDTYSTSKKGLDILPQSYTDVPPVFLSSINAVMPKLEGPNKSDCKHIPLALQTEYKWLDHVRQVISVDNVNDSDDLTWAAYHASCTQGDGTTRNSTTSISCLLPLFYEDAKSIAMIRHGMDIVKNTVNIINPGQVPIITADQPLYTLCKEIQWTWPHLFGEDRFVVMFGGLHIEMNALKMLGDLLDCSGWVGALTQANVASAGTADSYLKVSHVTRTRHAHQVTASSLYILLHKAYTEYISSRDDEASVKPLEAWCDERSKVSPQFHFWFTILQLELKVMVFVRSLREADFQLYIESLSQLVPWFFSLDHSHYARWIPVHLRDMIMLERKHPTVYQEFMLGNFTVKKTGRAFSNMAIDQAHEQNNAFVKSEGGAVGLTQNPSALRRWMVCGPEMARLIEEFQASYGKPRTKSDLRHHEQTKSTQNKFFNQVKMLTNVIEEMGNPFIDESNELLVLDTRDLADPGIVNAMRIIEITGQQQYDEFVNERLISQSKHIKDPIKRNKFPLFSRPPARAKSQGKYQLASVKNDCALFSSLYISCQTREGDIDEFFAHENQAYPPSLSNMGKLRLGTKSDIVNCLESLVPIPSDIQPGNSLIPAVEAVILDGAVIVNMLKPGTARTFSDYASQIFLPYIERQLQQVQRLDVVWDEYFDNSLKTFTRSMRGKGCRRRVETCNVIPKNWQEFLRNDENKSELFSFLSLKIANLETLSQVITTHHKDVLCIQSLDTTGLAPCTHEEADTRIFLHVLDAVNHGFKSVMIRTVDTDVLVLAVSAVQKLSIDELWVAFSSGKSLRYLPAHEISHSLGPQKCTALPFLHAFSGCDTVSAFAGRGKKTVWDVWNSFDDVTPIFSYLASTPCSVEGQLELIERYVVLLYDRASSEEKVNRARKQLFSKKGRTMEGLPPTQAALLEHTKRAAFQAGHVWAQMFVPVPSLPCPSEWGWLQTAEGGWEVKWTSLPEASLACRELLRCGCKKSCKGQCKCVKAALMCTGLCQCEGLCDRE